jgi:hypothetical protein
MCRPVNVEDLATLPRFYQAHIHCVSSQTYFRLLSSKDEPLCFYLFILFSMKSYSELELHDLCKPDVHKFLCTVRCVDVVRRWA